MIKWVSGLSSFGSPSHLTLHSQVHQRLCAPSLGGEGKARARSIITSTEKNHEVNPKLE